MIIKEQKPILSIAIPTFNRSDYLKINLNQLRSEINDCNTNDIEILVSDNASEDDTQSIVESFQMDISIRYYKNNTNIGSDHNIAQCFNMAKGRYVLILGDDDLFVDGALLSIMNCIKNDSYGAIYIKAYGYDFNYRTELPSISKKYRVYNNSEKFLERVSYKMTLISCCIINKDILGPVDTNRFCGNNLVQVHLFLLAALKAKQNLFINSYFIAAKRNNSGGYDFSTVFVTNYFSILDSYESFGLSKNTVINIENNMVIAHFPYRLYMIRKKCEESIEDVYKIFNKRFEKKILFKIFLVPILTLCRPLGLAWGLLMTLVGRVYNGELHRGVLFALNKLKYMFKITS
jgi:abequosyltransferase